MNFSDWTGLIALIIALLVPSITTLLNNLHTSRLKKIEINQVAEKERIQCLRQYLSATNACLVYSSEENMRSCGSAFGNALPYFPAELHPIAVSINENIQRCEWDDARKQYSIFSIKVAALIQP